MAPLLVFQIALEPFQEASPGLVPRRLNEPGDVIDLQAAAAGGDQRSIPDPLAPEGRVGDDAADLDMAQLGELGRREVVRQVGGVDQQVRPSLGVGFDAIPGEDGGVGLGVAMTAFASLVRTISAPRTGRRPRRRKGG